MNKENETICYFIFGVGKANGGHYRSLITVAEAMSDFYNVIIINVGFTHSHIIKKSSVVNHYVFYDGFNFLTPLIKIKKIIKNTNLKILHAFDSNSFFLCRLLSLFYKIPVIHTKCGGINPKGYFPVSSYLTLFSGENLQYFQNNKKFIKTKLELIPNRIVDFECDTNKIQLLKKKHNLQNYKHIFLKISRISKYYQESILQSINLIKYLNKEGGDVALLILGNVQDEQVYISVLNITNDLPNVFIETDKDFTLNANKIIDISDFVIGTGRGFMEACCKSKIMLSPAIYYDYPVLINQENFNEAFKMNFSERVMFDNITLDENLTNIKKLLSSNDKIKEKKSLSHTWFELYFNIESGKEKYMSLYEKAIYFRDNYFDIISHFFFVIKNNIGTWYRKFISIYG